MLKISIIDCAINQTAHACFNQLVDHFEHKFHYHHPPKQGMVSLNSENQGDAYIVLGSASHLEDNLLWHKELADFCLKKLKEGVPILGICFGHQLIGDKLGARVIRNPGNKSFHGSRELKMIKADWGFKEQDCYRVLTAHSFCIDPLSIEQAQLNILATSDECAVDIIAHKQYPFLGVQGHPEGSDIFINNDIAPAGAILKSEVKEAAQADGLRIIERFISKSEMLKRRS